VAAIEDAWRIEQQKRETSVTDGSFAGEKPKVEQAAGTDRGRRKRKLKAKVK